MKISKSLLQAIMVGVVVGTAATSCEKIKETDEKIIKKANDNSLLDPLLPDPQPSPYACPACGMG